MVQKRGSQDCHCVYPVRVELFLRNVSLTSNWSDEFLGELASQLSLRVTQFEIVNFYVVGASGLNITMYIAPHTGISFSADQVTAMNYSLSQHTVQINPVLVGDYNLLNLTWFRPLVLAPGNANWSWLCSIYYNAAVYFSVKVENTVRLLQFFFASLISIVYCTRETEEYI